MPKVSIIIPVYNAEKYINRCYDSLRNQSYTDWEAIFVNDGSIDNSLGILHELSNSDNRVRLISRPNTGVSKAREDGIKAACGKYITFLDVDDYLDSDGINNAVILADNGDVDVLLCGFKIISGNKSTTVAYKPQVLSFDNVVINLSRQSLRWNLWGNLYKRALFDNDITTLKVTAAEDYVLFLQIVSYAKNIHIANCPFYNYVQEPMSASHQKGTKYLEDSLIATLWCLKQFSSICTDNAAKNGLSAIVLLTLASCLAHNLSLSNDYVKKAFKESYHRNSLKILPIRKRIVLTICRILI